MHNGTKQPRPLLSICVLTYNHAKYIKQTLDSILMQELDVEYEILVADDASTDGTRSIIEDYVCRHPDRFRPMLRHTNVGVADNLTGLLRAARGKYIAYVEGDDYWLHPLKLKTQLEFLEDHPRFAITFHNAREVDEQARFEPYLYCPVTQKIVSSLEDLFVRNFIPSCSVVFRNSLYGVFPKWYVDLARTHNVGDWPLHILSAHHGLIRYFDDVWGVHRHHPGGVWSTKQHTANVAHTIAILNTLARNLDVRYRLALNNQIAEHYITLAHLLVRDGDGAMGLFNIYRASRLRPNSRGILSRRTIATALRGSFQMLAQAVEKPLKADSASAKAKRL